MISKNVHNNEVEQSGEIPGQVSEKKQSRYQRIQVEVPVAMMAPQDIANFLRVDYYTVRDLRTADRLPPPDVMIGNRPRWFSDTIKSYVRSVIKI